MGPRSTPLITPCPGPPQIERAWASRAAAAEAAAAAATGDAGGPGGPGGGSGAGVWTAFVEGLLRVDPSKRYSAHQALSRDIFESDAVADRARCAVEQEAQVMAAGERLGRLLQSLGLMAVSAESCTGGSLTRSQGIMASSPTRLDEVAN